MGIENGVRSTEKQKIKIYEKIKSKSSETKESSAALVEEQNKVQIVQEQEHKKELSVR